MEPGIDPIHLGGIVVVDMEIGRITPPAGLTLVVTSGVAGMSRMAVVRAALPFLAALFVILITCIPWLSTVLPETVMREGTALPAPSRHDAASACTMGTKFSALRLAPPTSAPFTFVSAKSSAALPALTDPP